MHSQQKGLNQQKTNCFQNIYNAAGDSTISSHMLPYEDVLSKRREAEETYTDTVTYSYKQRASKSVGMSPWQLSTVLKFSPKELWQWKFLGEKRIKENSWLEVIDTKSLRYKER